jgi:copper transport protein
VALVLVLAVAGRTLLVRVPWLAVAAVLATLALPSLGGHAATASPALVAVLSDAVHVLAAAVWVGGLGVLVLTWAGDRGRIQRYSSMALVAAPALVAAGVVSAWIQLRGTSALVDTDYGRLVLAKVVGAGVMLGLGLVHRRRVAGPGEVGALRPTLVAQTMLGVAVLAVTAVLVATPPPAAGGSDGRPVTVDGTAGETRVRMEVIPAVAGPNDLHLYYSTADGTSAPVDAAELTVATGGVEPRKVPLTAITPSHATALGVQLTPGTWRFELTVVAGGVPATTTFEVPVT